MHPLLKFDKTLAQLTGIKRFRKLDANCGFWPIPKSKSLNISRPSSHPLVLCFYKIPVGISSALDHFQRRMSEILEVVMCHVDDALVFAPTQQEHDVRFCATLTKIQVAGLTLNK